MSQYFRSVLCGLLLGYMLFTTAQNSNSESIGVQNTQHHHHNHGSVSERAIHSANALHSKQTQNCSESCRYNENSPYAGHRGVKLIDDLITKLHTPPTKGLWLVSRERKHATSMLLKLAIMSCQHGDIAETGVFKGGSSILIMKLLLEMDQCSRKFYVFDSFEGFPTVAKNDIRTENNQISKSGDFKATQELFVHNLQSMHVWEESIIVVAKGWFSDTIPKSPVQKLAFLRLDGDLYVSTMDALNGLYPKLISGGYIYIDDYGSFQGCKDAVDEYRTKYNITDEIHEIQEEKGKKFEAIWWRKA